MAKTCEKTLYCRGGNDLCRYFPVVKRNFGKYKESFDDINTTDTNEWTFSNIFWFIIVLIVFYLCWIEYNRS